jgi:hypothetical protein
MDRRSPHGRGRPWDPARGAARLTRLCSESNVAYGQSLNPPTPPAPALTGPPTHTSAHSRPPAARPAPSQEPNPGRGSAVRVNLPPSPRGAGLRDWLTRSPEHVPWPVTFKLRLNVAAHLAPPPPPPPRRTVTVPGRPGSGSQPQAEATATEPPCRARFKLGHAAGRAAPGPGHFLIIFFIIAINLFTSNYWQLFEAMVVHPMGVGVNISATAATAACAAPAARCNPHRSL